MVTRIVSIVLLLTSGTAVAERAGRPGRTFGTPTAVRKNPWSETAVQVRTCFTWDAMPGAVISGFRLYVSETSGSFPSPAAVVGSGDVSRLCVDGLTQGRQYYASVAAFNSFGDGPLSAQLAFRPAYIITKTNMNLVQGFNAAGYPRISFTGPAHIMEANLGFVQWSPDLVTWYPLPVAWEYVGGVYSFLMPKMGDSAFFRLGFEWGVR